MNCPVCMEKTHLKDQGWSHGHHVFICGKCGRWLEEITKLRTLPVAIKRLIQGGN